MSGSGTESDIKQKQVEVNSLELSMKPEAQPIASGVCGQFTNTKWGCVYAIINNSSKSIN